MAAARNRPGDFILEVASSGMALTTAIAKHITSQGRRDAGLENLFVDLSVLASLLNDLATTINKYENFVDISDHITRPICEICADDFDKLHVILRETEGVKAWAIYALFCAALGGNMAAFRRMEMSRQSLLLLSDTVKCMIFGKLKEENRLDSFHADDSKSLEAELPHIATTLEPVEEQCTSRLKPPYRRLREVSARLPGKPFHDLETSSQTTLAELSASPQKKCLFDGKPSDFPENGFCDISSAFPNEDIFRGSFSTRRRSGLLGDDHCSISSFDTMAANQFLDTDEIYEEWVLKWTMPKREHVMTWSLIGLKIAEYEEKKGYWSLEPQFRSQAELKEKHTFETCGIPRSKHEAWIDKTTRALPTEAQTQLSILIEDREDSSSPGFQRHWFIAAIEPHHKESSLFGLRSKCTEWLVTIKGETISELGTSRPSRFRDAWMKPMSREEYRARRRRDRKQLENPTVRNREPRGFPWAS